MSPVYPGSCWQAPEGVRRRQSLATLSLVGLTNSPVLATFTMAVPVLGSQSNMLLGKVGSTDGRIPWPRCLPTGIRTILALGLGKAKSVACRCKHGASPKPS